MGSVADSRGRCDVTSCVMLRYPSVPLTNVLEKLLGFIMNKENAFSRKRACVKWKYLLACGSYGELR
jgi:hypothetical protein